MTKHYLFIQSLMIIPGWIIILTVSIEISDQTLEKR